MSKAVVTFKRCIQVEQDLGTDDDCMRSRIFFDLEIEGKRFPDLSTDIKQVVGSNYSVDNIEVGPPVGYDGPFSHLAFSECARKYYVGCVGSQGSGIRVEGGGHLLMQNNVIEKSVVCEFDVSN